MLALKYLLLILGSALFGSSGALVVYDIYLSSQLRRLLGRRNLTAESPQGGEESAAIPGVAARVGAPADSNAEFARPFGTAARFPQQPVRWGLAWRLALAGLLPLLLAFSIAVVPDGFGGVRVSQFWGARPGTL